MPTSGHSSSRGDPLSAPTAENAGSATAGVPQPRRKRRSRGRGLVTTALLFPAAFWYLVLLVLPLAIVVLYSFGTRGTDGGYTPAFVFDNYQTLFSRPDPFILSLLVAVTGTAACLFIGFPFAYFLATRAGKRKTLLLVLLVIPFWTSFLVRTIAWLIILGPDGLEGFIQTLTGVDVAILGSPWAILLGIVYNYLPLMVFPLYVTLERLDPTLLEASKDLGAGRWATFRQITLPISLPGLITGSILVFIPLMGEYVIPSILGLGKVFLIGNVLQLDFLGSRNWPAGSAKAVTLIVVMLVSVTFYVWTSTRSQSGGRDVSVL